MRKGVLDQLQYHYASFTGIYRSPRGYVYYLVYDYGFSPIVENEKEKALIIHRQEYMENPGFEIWKKGK